MIVFKYVEVRNINNVRSFFGKKYYPKHSIKVPQLVFFKRIVDCFCKIGSCMKDAAVRIFLQNEGSNVRCAFNGSGLSCGTVWSILRRKNVFEAVQVMTVK